MKTRLSLVFVFLFFFTNSLIAKTDISKQIFSTQDNRFISFDQLIYNLASTEFIILGESHDNEAHHKMQKKIIENVALLGPVSVGLEFIEWTQQEYLNSYTLNSLSETEFLNAIEWGNNFSFNFYRPLIWAAVNSGGHAFGINAPSAIIRKIARSGLESLNMQEQTYIPPNFQINNGLYFERFCDTMTNHPLPPSTLQRYFEAHNLWDNTMAFYSILNMQHSYAPFFIIVGNFHAEYKLGLPAQLARRLGNNKNLAVITHVDVSDMTENEIALLTKPDPKYGILADYIILTTK